MRRVFRILSLWAVALSVGAVSAFAQGQPVPGQPELKVGDMAPDFTLPASDGKTYSLSQLRGKYVVLAWFPKAFTAG
jgi:peroxiredoxin